MKNKKLDYNKTGNYRPFYSMDEFVKSISNLMTVWSWGAHDYTKINEHFLRFKVQAHRHKGYIYVCVNASDYFEVYLTDFENNIVKVFEDVFVGDFIDIIDKEIEFIDDYVR